MKILILTIATNKYIQFVERLYDNIEEKFFTVDEMGQTFDNFYARINDYNPKDYVKENLSFESSVKTLLDILK